MYTFEHGPRVGPFIALFFGFAVCALQFVAQTPTPTPPVPTRAEILRGEYGRYRANNDLLSYNLDVRIDPEKKGLSGKNTIRFKTLEDDNRIQLRSIVNDDKRWFRLIHDFYQHFKYQNIMIEDVAAYFSQQTGINLTPIFDEYLRHTTIPKLDLKFDDRKGTVSYRWVTDERGFAMPVKVGTKDNWLVIRPTTDWKEIKTTIKKDKFEVA